MEHLCECKRRERCFLGRLHELRTSRSKGGSELSRDHRQRKIPRGDGDGRTDGFAQDEDAPIANARRGQITCSRLCGRCCEIKEARCVLDFATALNDRLAALRCQQRCETPCFGTDARSKPSHELDALQHR